MTHVPTGVVTYTLPLEAAASPDSKKPYGDVAYADPGYQADKKKRYPLDSEEHCRAAWSYINMPENAAKYSSGDLVKVKAKIRAALERYGADVQAAAASDLLGVELARPGTWKLKTGQTEFTDQMLRDAADFFQASGGQAVPIGLGHTDDRFDGEPTFGLVTNVRYHTDERGPVLLGDITGMPGWLAAAAPSRWPNRSIEGWQDFDYEGRSYSLVLSALKFLGTTPPGVRNIRSLADLKTALAASSARRLVASAPEDDEATPPSEQDEQTPTPEVEEVEEEKEAGMDPAKIREALGLSADASDEEVGTAWSAAGLPTAAPPPEPAPVPVAASAAPGTIVLASSTYEQMQSDMKKLTDFVDQSKRNARDEVIAKGVKDGKFTPAQKPQFAKLWDADPDGTRKLIEETLTPNSALAVMASGYATDAEDTDAEYAALFSASKAG